MMGRTSDRNYSIDTIKFFACVLVVFIHASYPYKNLIYPLNGIASSVFFCISGFFIYGSAIKISRIKKTLKLMIWAVALYLIKTELFWLISGKGLYLPTFRVLLNFIIFNDVSVAIHLWYLPAYLYVLIIVYIVERFNKWKVLFLLTPLLLLLYAIVRYYLGGGGNIHYFRNFLFVGLPYFSLGAMMRKFTDSMNKSASKWYVSILHKGYVVLFLMLFFLTIRYFLHCSSLFNTIIYSFISYVVVALVFLCALAFPQNKQNVFSFLGQRYSLYVYLFHLIIMSFIEYAVCFLPLKIKEAYMLFNPFFIVLLTILFTFILKKIKIIKS